MARNFKLVGSGSRLSPTGSQYQMSLQGIDAHLDDVYFPSLLPRVRQGAPMSMWRMGEKISDKHFDDTISLPHSGTIPNLDGEGNKKLQLRVNFDWEKLNFGQAPSVSPTGPYVETNRYDAVEYIRASEETMWPVNLFNLGSLLEHEFDGVIEPLDIRSELLGLVRPRFEGHSVRGGLTGGASETYFGSKQIVDKWKVTDEKLAFFLDAPISWDTIPIGAYSNITHEPDAPWKDIPGYEITNKPLTVNNTGISGLSLTNYAITTSTILIRYSNLHNNEYVLPHSANLLAWWRMNTDVSTSGDAIDSSGNARNGTYAALTRRPLPSTSVPAPYIQLTSTDFDGALDQTDIGDDSVWEPLIGGNGAASKPFSIVFWINPDLLGTNTNQGVIWFGSSLNEPHRGVMYNKSTGLLLFGVGSSVSNLANLNAGVWTHVALTYAGGAASPARAMIYMNGVQSSFLDIANGDVQSISGLGRVGSTYSSLYFDGLLADVSIWNKALSADEVKALRDASNGVYFNEPQEDTLIEALRDMAVKDSGDYGVIDPAEKRANHGFYFGQNAGSIAYGDEDTDK